MSFECAVAIAESEEMSNLESKMSNVMKKKMSNAKIFEKAKKKIFGKFYRHPPKAPLVKFL